MLKAKKIVSVIAALSLVTGLCPAMMPEQAAAAKPKLNKNRAVVEEGSTVTLKVKRAKKRAAWSVRSGKQCVRLFGKTRNSVKVMGESAGTARIQAKVGRKRLTCTVVVRPGTGGLNLPSVSPAASFTPTTVPASPKPSATVAASASPSSSATEKPGKSAGASPSADAVQSSKKPAATQKPGKSDTSDDSSLLVIESGDDELPDIYYTGSMNQSDVNVLAVLIREQTDNGADVSNDLENENQYTWNGDGTLEGIDWSDSSLAGSISFTGLDTLEQVFLDNNKGLTEIDVTDNKELYTLSCKKTGIESLNLTKNTELEQLYCDDTALSALNVSKNKKLEELYCENTNISTLNLEGLYYLKELNINGTDISSIDVSDCSLMRVIYCMRTLLSELDVGGCEELQEIYCDDDMTLYGTADEVIHWNPAG